MLIDLHCHSLPRSTCSALQPAQLIELARERGLDGVCFTEHDRAWPPEEIQRLRSETGFVVLSAVELTTDLGHVLAFGLGELDRPLVTAHVAFALAQERGGLLFLAHPARDGLLRVTHETVEYFDSVEAINGSDTRLQNVAGKGLAHGFRLPGIGGSDCHSPAEVGRAATRFTATVSDEASLVAALRSGEYEAVTVE